MIITEDELLQFFVSKIECSLSQIKNRGRRISTGYRIGRSRAHDMWVLPVTLFSIHPLDLVLENQKILCDRSKTAAIARRLNCKKEFIDAFNNGLRGELFGPKNSMEHKFFTYGRKIRTERIKKALKKATY